MDVVEGSNITLRCNVERPFVNTYTVMWRKADGDDMNLPTGIFDLELPNVSLSDNDVVYRCRVVSNIDQPTSGADAIATITLRVTRLHSKL